MQAWKRVPAWMRFTRWCSSTPSVKVRDGQVANRPVYLAMGVTVAGERDILGLWAGTAGRCQVLDEGSLGAANRGVKDVCLVVCDGLKGLPDAVGAAGRRQSSKRVSST